MLVSLIKTFLVISFSFQSNVLGNNNLEVHLLHNEKINMVQMGDSLYRIAKKIGVTKLNLRKWNKLESYMHFVDQILYVSKPINFVEDKPKEVYIKVESLMQNPELPNGCEIVSLTAVLNYYGYSVSKLDMADKYLPKEEFKWVNGKRFGPDPFKIYAGNPRSKTSGWYTFAPTIVEATENYMLTQVKKTIAKDISGSNQKDLLEYLDNGKPIVVWTTLDLSKPILKSHWYLSDTGEYHSAYTNLHSVVLHGYKDGKVYVMDPLKGHVEYDMNKFFKSYKEMGKHALVLENQNE